MFDCYEHQSNVLLAAGARIRADGFHALKNNELFLQIWKNPKIIPIQAFFYLSNIPRGMHNAMKQRREFKTLTGRDVPVVSITLPTAPNYDVDVHYIPEKWNRVTDYMQHKFIQYIVIKINNFFHFSHILIDCKLRNNPIPIKNVNETFEYIMNISFILLFRSWNKFLMQQCAFSFKLMRFIFEYKFLMNTIKRMF